MKLLRSIYSIFFILVLSLSCSSGIEASCRVATPSEGDIIGRESYTSASIKGLIRDEQEKGLTEAKARGVVGELVAVEYIHSHYVFAQIHKYPKSAGRFRV